jgi:hypothetical protein
MATWYVSNAASNGYGLGNDTTGNGTMATPYLTINKANLVASNGDTVVINPSGSPYSEDSGSGYLNVTHNITIETDQLLVGTFGKISLRSTAGSRMINVSSTGMTLIDVKIDGTTNTGSPNFVTTQSSGAPCFFTRVDWINCAAGTAFLQTANSIVTFDKCTATTVNGNASSFKMCAPFNGGISTTFLGCTYSGIGGVWNQGGNFATTLIKFGASGDGTRNTITNIATFLTWPPSGTQTRIDVQYCDFSGTGTTGIGAGSSATETITTFVCDNCTWASSITYNAIQFYGTTSSIGSITIGASNVFNGKASYVVSSGMGFANATVLGTVSNSSATADPINISSGGSGIQIGGLDANRNPLLNITSDWGAGLSGGHMIIVGVDGQGTIVNNLTASSTVNFGDLSTDIWLYQPVTVPTAFTSHNISSSFRIKMKIGAGSPTGVITGYLYSDNAGVPGTLLATSDTVVNANTLTSTATWYEFWFNTHPTIAPNTKYHVVISKAAADPSNYVAIITSSTATVGGTSANGTVWTPGSFTTLFQLMYGAFEIVDPVISGVKITSTTTGATGVHMAMLGATLGGRILDVQPYGGAISFIGKLADGSNSSHPLVIGPNVGFQANSTNSARSTLRDKGCRNMKFYQNTCVCNGDGTSGPVQIDQDFESTNTPQYNSQPSLNNICENNIYYGQNASAQAYIYVLGNTQTTGPRVVNPTINNDLIFLGTNFKAMDDVRSGSGTVYNGLADIQGIGFDINGASGDPLLANETNPSQPSDFLPASNSPAKAIGVNTNGGAATDFNGNAFAFTPDAGAFSFTTYYAGLGITRGYYNSNTGVNNGQGYLTTAMAALFGSSFLVVSTTVSATIPANTNSYMVTADATAGNVVLTLPTAVGISGKEYRLHKTDSGGNSVAFAGSGGQTIAGTATTSAQDGVVRVQSNGANWITC